MNNNFKLRNGSGRLCCKGCGRQDKQLNTYDWLADIPNNAEEQEIVEVQFKNTRKGYFKNSNKLKLEKGDIVLSIRGQLKLAMFESDREDVLLSQKLHRISRNNGIKRKL